MDTQTLTADLTAQQMKRALRNACWLGVNFAIARYLMANLQSRLNGVEKADRHRELCNFYVAILTGEDPDRAASFQPEIHDAIHRRTQARLTDRLDEAIGFDPNGGSDHLADMRSFFEIFHETAFAVAAEFPSVCKFRQIR
tara:strand:+ start:55 stop:477 length:423 start_codon:yes stop_codon:yes gene_type:complete